MKRDRAYLEVPGGEIIAQDGVPETAQKEEKAEEKILRSKRQRYHRKVTHKKKRKIQTPRMILQQKQVQENRQPKLWY